MAGMLNKSLFGQSAASYLRIKAFTKFCSSGLSGGGGGGLVDHFLNRLPSGFEINGPHRTIVGSTPRAAGSHVVVRLQRQVLVPVGAAAFGQRGSMQRDAWSSHRSGHVSRAGIAANIETCPLEQCQKLLERRGRCKDAVPSRPFDDLFRPVAFFFAGPGDHAGNLVCLAQSPSDFAEAAGWPQL